MKKENNSRRLFLRNAALAGLSLGAAGHTFASSKKSFTVLGGCNPATLDYYGQGPFYTAEAPMIVDNLLASIDEPGTRLVISGIVQTLDCTATIPNTKIDIWHANDAGAYDNTGYTLRGVTYTNAEGFYLFETVLPGKYLNGASYRPRHIHFKITPPGFPTLTTQLYFEGDTDIPGDAAASITTGTFDATHRIIPITLNGAGKYEGTWDINLNGEGGVGVADIHLDKGIIYAVTPNPFQTSITIQYGVFTTAKVSVQVFDMKGNQVALLEEKTLTPQKYNINWSPDASIINGYYFIVLKINDMQVHYQKVFKM